MERCMKKKCCVCEKDNTSYKCPTCRASYCSLACYKQHKSQPCSPPPPEEPEESKKHENVVEQYRFPTDDTVSFEKLKLLHHSEELKKILGNLHVRNIMMEIMNSVKPTEAIELAMREPIFVEMADACLKIVEPSDEARPF